MEWSDLLDFLARTLSELKIEYFVTGSSATITYGEPRFTNDIDIVAFLKPTDVVPLCDAFAAPAFYVSREAVQQAIQHRRMFNIIHPSSGLKIDVAVPAESEFNNSRRTRTVEVTLKTDTRVNFASPEDVILKKMEYFREGGSEKHLRDITGVLKICDPPVDREYVDLWASHLQVEDVWQQIQSQSGDSTAK